MIGSYSVAHFPGNVQFKQLEDRLFSTAPYQTNLVNIIGSLVAECGKYKPPRLLAVARSNRRGKILLTIFYELDLKSRYFQKTSSFHKSLSDST